jgi:hypothetical protein
LSYGTSAFGEFEGKVSSYLWANQGEFVIEGKHPQILNNWNIYHPTDSLMPSGNIYIFEADYNQIISIDISFYSGFIRGEKQRYMVHNSGYYLTDLSYSEAEGRSSLGSASLYYRLTGKDLVSISQLDIGMGYLRYKNSVSYKNPYIVYDSFDPSNNNKKLAETLEKYDISYNGLDFRIKEELYLTRDISLTFMIGYSPQMKARLYSVKYPERSPSEQSRRYVRTKGDGVQYEVKSNYYFTPRFSATFGYKYLLLRTKGKISSGFYPMFKDSEEEIKNQMGGFLLGLMYHF